MPLTSSLAAVTSHLEARTLTASLAAAWEQKPFLAATWSLVLPLAEAQPSIDLTISAVALFSQPAARMALTRVAALFSHLSEGMPLTSSLAAVTSHLEARTLTASLAAAWGQKPFLAVTFAGAFTDFSLSANTEMPRPRKRATTADSAIALRILSSCGYCDNFEKPTLGSLKRHE